MHRNRVESSCGVRGVTEDPRPPRPGGAHGGTPGADEPRELRVADASIVTPSLAKAPAMAAAACDGASPLRAGGGAQPSASRGRPVLPPLAIGAAQMQAAADAAEKEKAAAGGCL